MPGYVRPGESQTIDLVMNRGATIEGLVTLDGVAEQGARVQYSRIQILPSYVQYRTDSDSAGLYYMENVPPGPGNVTASLTIAGTTRNISRSVEVAGSEALSLNLAFSLGTAEVRGYIKEESGEPLTAFVSVAMDKQYFYAQSGPDGSFHLRNLPAGPARLRANIVEHYSEYVEIGLVRGEIVEQNLLMR